jgi:hypothetical protein
MTIRKILLAAALAAGAAGAHAAVTYDATGGLTSTEPGPVVTNTFDDGLLPTGFATYDLTPGALIPFPGNSGYAALPPADTSAYFFSVGATHGQPSMSGVSFAGNGVSYFGYYMGSPDNYNIVTLYSGNTVVLQISGTEMAAAANTMANGNQGTGFYMNFHGNGTNITRVTFAANTDAFETDNHSYIMAVPEPETYAMLLAGMGLVGFAARRRKA